MSSETSSPSTPPQSPLFRALQASRYERQQGIRDYEEATGRSLVVFWGTITPEIVTPFADAINDVGQDSPLDLMLTSFGGDGETALRMAMICHMERNDFRVIVPDISASAATLLALAAESVIMSSTSSLGPIDPQIRLPIRGHYVSARGILEIVDDLDRRTKENPQAFELYAALLADVDAVIYQLAKAAMARTTEFIPELLRLRQNLPSSEVGSMSERLSESLQNQAMHSATIGHTKAVELGIPAEYMSPSSEEWDRLWRLHTYYVAEYGPLPHNNIIEGRRVSFFYRHKDA